MQSIANTSPVEEKKTQKNFRIKANEVFKQKSSINTSSFAPLTFLFILEKKQCEYLYISGCLNNILTPTQPAISNYFTQQWHKDDAYILSENIFPEIEKICLQNNSIKDTYTFSFNFRIRSNTDEWRVYMQSITSLNNMAPGLPLHFTGIITDITHFKTDNKIVFIAEKNNPDKTMYQLIVHENFSPDKNNIHLTKRELEVLKCLNDGLSSKQIANKLFASQNTINNHRKNILKKTNTKNTSELIGMALKKGIIF